MKFLLVAVALVLFSSFALAVPPVVDFTWTPNSPLVFQQITFDPNITANGSLTFLKWGFATDGNINYSIINSNLTIFSDNFNDTDISDWSQISGTWSAASGYLDGGNAGSAAISTSVTDLNVLNDSNVNIFYRDKPTGGGTNGLFAWMTNQSLYPESPGNGFNGYLLYLGSSDNGSVAKVTNGTPVTILGNLGTIANGSYHDINILHSSDGNINVWINGVDKGQVVDTTYTSGSKIVFAINNGITNHNFDDVLITKTGQVFINSDVNENFTFSTAGTKPVCLSARNNDGTTTTCHDVNVMGAGIFQIFDENTDAVITSGVAEINGQQFYSDTNGVINVGLAIPTGDYLVKITANNYPARYFDFHFDLNTSFSKQIYLLDANKGRAISFLIRDVNNVKYPDRIFRVIKNNKYVSQVPTNARAITEPIWLANLATDYNYFVDTNTTSNNIFSYQNSTLKVKVPINENTFDLITPFGVEITDLTSVDRNNLTTDQLFTIYPNTWHPYKIIVDANNLLYFDRFYHIRTKGGETNRILQPYMLRPTDGAAAATMTIVDSLSQIKVPYFLVEFYGDVGTSPNVLVESQQSDSAGEFVFSSITGKNYNLIIYDEDGDVFNTFTFLSNASSEYFLNTITGLITTGFPITGVVDVNIIVPQNNLFYLNASNNFGLQFQVNSTGPTFSSVAVAISSGTTSLYTNTFNPTFPNTTFSSGQVFDANFTTSLDNVPVSVVIQITTENGVVTKNYSFPLKQTSSPGTTFPPFSNVIDDVGVLGGVLIWFFIAILLSIGLRYNPVFGIDNSAMIFVLIIWTGIAAFMGILNIPIAFIAILGGVAYYGLSKRSLG